MNVTTPSTEQVLADVVAELALVRAELAELKAARQAAAETDLATDEAPAGEMMVTSRRRLFAIAGGAAAAAVALGTASSATPAAAITGYGVTMVLGAQSDATSVAAKSTHLNYFPAGVSVDGSNYFTVSDLNPTNTSSDYPAAVAGWAFKNLETGVYGFANSGLANGVVGAAYTNNLSYGVWGIAQDGVGVVGESQGTGYDFKANGTGRVNLTSHIAAGAPTSGSYAIGDLIRDDNGDWFVCYDGGTPGSWRKLGGGTTAGALHVINPTRVYDSRLFTGPLAAGFNRVVAINNGIDLTTGAVNNPNVVPDGATAIAYNLTVVPAPGSGYLAVTPGDAADFSASAINWTPTTGSLANGTLVKLDSTRHIKAFARGGATDFIIDVTGYYL